MATQGFPATFPNAVPTGVPSGFQDVPGAVPVPQGFPPPPKGNSLPAFTPLSPEDLARLPHDDLGPMTLATVWALAFVSTIFLVARLYCKFTRHRGLWWDDYLLSAAWIAQTLGCAITAVVVPLGYGKHIYDIPFANLMKLPIYANIGGTANILAAVWSKTSFAITLLRITQGWTWAFVWCIIVTMNVAMGLSALFIWIQCTPIEKAWNPMIAGTCFPAGKIIDYLMFSGGYSAAMDIILALLPWKLVWPLNMRRKEKIGVIVAMSMGIFAGATAIIKVTQTPRIKSGDIYDGVVLVVWSIAESAVTIMAASVPILRALLKRPNNKNVKPPPPTQRPQFHAMAESFTMQTQSTVVIESRRRSYDGGSGLRRKGEEEQDWQWSDRNSMENLPTTGKILQIHEVDVQYEPQDPADAGRQV